jgi:hypothetical protein
MRARIGDAFASQCCAVAVTAYEKDFMDHPILISPFVVEVDGIMTG